jgi:dipeptidyl aminopeptidase/acylaminoacyl peptidase
VDLIKAATMDVLWSKDMQTVAIKYLGVVGHAQSETVRVLDIHLCNESLPVKKDDFPAERFPFGSNIKSIDWDGEELFLLNSDERNGGFGNLYLYNTTTHQANAKLNVVGPCCYRDARFSPDGSYVIFAYQDNTVVDAPIKLYYIPAGSLTTPGNYKPIEQLAEDFFEDGRKESPQPALRPVK